LLSRNRPFPARGLSFAQGPPLRTPSRIRQRRSPHFLPNFTQNPPFAYFFMKIDHFAGICRLMKKGKSALPLHFLVVSL